MSGFEVNGAGLRQLLDLAPGGFQRALLTEGITVEMRDGEPVAVERGRIMTFEQLGDRLRSVPTLQFDLYQAGQDISRMGDLPHPARFPDGPDIPHPAARRDMTADELVRLLQAVPLAMTEVLRRAGYRVEGPEGPVQDASGTPVLPAELLARAQQISWLHAMLQELSWANPPA